MQSHTPTQIDQLLEQGFVIVTDQTEAPPSGYSVRAKGCMFIACSDNGVRSAFVSKYEVALGWAKHHAFVQSGLYPLVGELWLYDGRTAIICGNSITEQKTIWVMDWNSGDRAYAPVSDLKLCPERKSLTEAAIVERFADWGRRGSTDAMWWLAWWFEGRNHPKSVWYYVATLRADPKAYGWALDRILEDAKTPILCKGIADPDLSFLKEVPEVMGEPVGSDWQDAVGRAERAVHVPAAKPRRATTPRMFKAEYVAPGDATD